MAKKSTRKEQECIFSYRTYQTNRDGTPIPSTYANGKGTFSAIVHDDGRVQSICTPDGGSLHDLNRIEKVLAGTSYNLDDEGSIGIELLQQHGGWIVKRELP